MQGRRLPDDTTSGIRPGDYVKIKDVWWVRPPVGPVGPLITHQVEEHQDGTITVSPSILNEGEWHGYLEHGVWREA